MSLARYSLNLNKDNHDDIKWEMVNELSSPMYKYLDQAKIDLIIPKYYYSFLLN